MESFELQIKRFVDKAKGNVDLVVRNVALDLFLRVIEKSPVDTGRFKSNWQVAINSIPQGTFNVADPSGQPSIARVQSAQIGFAAGQVIYLVNNLEYARALEYGHSKQAPAGMVRLSIQEYGGVVRQAASEVPK